MGFIKHGQVTLCPVILVRSLLEIDVTTGHFLPNIYLYLSFEKYYQKMRCVCLFLCLEFLVPLKNVHSFGNITIVCEGVQILTFARLLWRLGSDGSVACQVYCDTGIHLCPSRLGFKPPPPTPQTFRLNGQRFNPLRHRRTVVYK